jgi:transcriptional regulator with XRE-family HTH domain
MQPELPRKAPAVTNKTKAQGELGAFLQACRARVRPDQVGVRAVGTRRVQGLRREELALLAGVSASYYARLEQGQSRNASPPVLEAIARALELSPAERQHLHTLAEAADRPVPVVAPPVETADPALLELLRALGPVPALVLGRRSDVLAWNPLGHALLAGHVDPQSVERPGERPNMVRVIFLDPHCRELYQDWRAKAEAVVGNLRLVAGKFPTDPELASLVGTLMLASPEFGRMWTDQRVQACEVASYDLRHPLIGRLTVTQQTLRSVHAAEQSLVTCTAPVGSPSAEALTLLAQLVAESEAGAGFHGAMGGQDPQRGRRWHRSQLTSSDIDHGVYGQPF